MLENIDQDDWDSYIKWMSLWKEKLHQMTEKKGCIEQMTMKNTSLLNDHNFHREGICGRPYTLWSWTREGKRQKKSWFYIVLQTMSLRKWVCLFGNEYASAVVAESIKCFPTFPLSGSLRNACTPLRNDYSSAEMVGGAILNNKWHFFFVF